MPYIPPEHRRAIDIGIPPENAGELNYKICIDLVNYLNVKGESYQTYNDIIGVLENVKLEIHRKLIQKYEDFKEDFNGTIWPKLDEGDV